MLRTIATFVGFVGLSVSGGVALSFANSYFVETEQHARLSDVSVLSDAVLAPDVSSDIITPAASPADPVRMARLAVPFRVPDLSAPPVTDAAISQPIISGSNLAPLSSVRPSIRGDASSIPTATTSLRRSVPVATVPRAPTQARAERVASVSAPDKAARDPRPRFLIGVYR